MAIEEDSEEETFERGRSRFEKKGLLWSILGFFVLLFELSVEALFGILSCFG